jgi:hypothetical protein
MIQRRRILQFGIFECLGMMFAAGLFFGGLRQESPAMVVGGWGIYAAVIIYCAMKTKTSNRALFISVFLIVLPLVFLVLPLMFVLGQGRLRWK